MLLDSEWLDRRSELVVQQRTLRQNGQESPRARSQGAQPHAFCDFSSDFMALATHMSFELGESLHRNLQLCVDGIPVADQLVSRVLRSRTLLLLVLHVLSMATSCTVSCFGTVSATFDTDFSSVTLITVAFSVTDCAVSDSTVIVVTEVLASVTTFRLRHV